MNIGEATRSYEAWMGEKTKLVKPDLKYKHDRMTASAFEFLRATYYRWLQLWPKVCPELAAAPRVLAAGDVHVENFGTWRDLEGRLVWGCNDLDEAYPEAYTIDLVRLATSAHLASREGHLQLDTKDACAMIAESYGQEMEEGGRPFVLAERHRWLREIALNKLRAPIPYWEKMEALPEATRDVPAGVRKVLAEQLPERGIPYRLKRRVVGRGSLGRQRLVALAEWHGGYVAREAKALLPSAHVWVRGQREGRIWYEEIIRRAVRMPDPFVSVKGNWILRRLAPDCSRIELASLPKERDEDRLLGAMARETANLHLGTKSAVASVKRDLKKRQSKWLHAAAKAMAAAMLEDWKEWRKSQ